MCHSTIPHDKLSCIPQNQILSLQEAKLRLQQLCPGTPEHHRLQDVLLKANGIAEITLHEGTYRVNTTECGLLGGFGASEHVAIGEAVRLHGLSQDTSLIVKGLNRLQFKHIIALAGDFYGVVGGAISLPGGTDEDKTKRFEAAFGTLENADDKQLQQVLAEIAHECHSVQHAHLPKHCYSTGLMEGNNNMQKIKGDVGELLADNSDHFSKNARDAYRIGHALAITAAREAGRLKSQGNISEQGLRHAYALDAFACHFLTDLFASGHIRNQRGDLETFFISQMGFGSAFAKKLAGLLTAAQHEEDGKRGLFVTSALSGRWQALGDGHFFTPPNAENKKKTLQATQASVDEVYNAYLHPDTITPSKMDQVIPELTSSDNHPPVYEVKETSLLLNEGKVEIRKGRFWISCVNECVAHALKFLPSDYVDTFIKGTIEELARKHLPLINVSSLACQSILPRVAVDKIFVLPATRVLGLFWRALGVATYRQIQQESLQLNQKTDEMAGILHSTYENTSKILQKVEEIDAKLDKLVQSEVFRNVHTHIQVIKKAAHEHKTYGTIATGKRWEQLENELWQTRVGLSSIFEDDTLLLKYKQMLCQDKLKNLSEIQLSLTLWFRQMLDYQIQAFFLYISTKSAREHYHGAKLVDLDEEIGKSVSHFESILLKQIEAHRTHILEELIVSSPVEYIALKLEKSKVKRTALIHLNKFN